MAAHAEQKRGRGRPKTAKPATRVGFNANADLVARLEAQLKRMGDQNPGATMTLSDAVRACILKGLELFEKQTQSELPFKESSTKKN